MCQQRMGLRTHPRGVPVSLVVCLTSCSKSSSQSQRVQSKCRQLVGEFVGNDKVLEVDAGSSMKT